MKNVGNKNFIDIFVLPLSYLESRKSIKKFSLQLIKILIELIIFE